MTGPGELVVGLLVGAIGPTLRVGTRIVSRPIKLSGRGSPSFTVKILRVFKAGLCR